MRAMSVWYLAFLVVYALLSIFMWTHFDAGEKCALGVQASEGQRRLQNDLEAAHAEQAKLKATVEALTNELDRANVQLARVKEKCGGEALSQHREWKAVYCPRDAAKQEAAGRGRGSYTSVAVALARTLEEVSEQGVKDLAALSCEHNVAVDVVVGDMQEWDLSKLALCAATRADCAPIKFHPEPAEVTARRGPYDNRVARIARIRDHQRQTLRTEYADSDVRVIMALDLDLLKIPDPVQLMRVAGRAAADPAWPDGTCALGQHLSAVGNEYYDTFATVYDDGTWAYPFAMRLLKDQHPPGEDVHKVVSFFTFGSFDQWDATNYIKHQASLADNGVAPMRSCFGGAAVYKAAAFLDMECKYEWTPPIEERADPERSPDTMWRFADAGMERACEHVIFHHCLKAVRGAKFGIDPLLVTHWLKPPEPWVRYVLMNDGARGPDAMFVENTIATYRSNGASSSTPTLTLESQNGQFRALIRDDGRLIVEDKATKRVKWSSDAVAPGTKHPVGTFQDNWDKMILILGAQGELLLYQQVLEASPENAHLCVRFLDAPEPRCRMLLWQLDGIGAGDYALFLHDTGLLELKSRYFLPSQEQVITTYWLSTWGNDAEEAKLYRKRTTCYRESCPDAADKAKNLLTVERQRQ
eukprot:TRINITY_DN19529_c0_g1_i1.p1 TRINITY_DN19529_c0_g1~~TRINITY_DN19529_c0_g1_i1.p1  ORF type:complete len:642 (+),score=155.05 TRINITY_DN19529_c0_g1_i1:102-2027(+)